MTLSLSSFNINSNLFRDLDIFIQEDCDENYRQLKEFAMSNGATEDEAENSAGDYWVNCVNNGGHSEVLELLSPF